jgi:hypothetical protein
VYFNKFTFFLLKLTDLKRDLVKNKMQNRKLGAIVKFSQYQLKKKDKYSRFDLNHRTPYRYFCYLTSHIS